MLVSLLRRAGVTALRIVHCDFEEGEIRAFRNNYPDAKIMGCDVHFRRFVQPENLLVGLILVKVGRLLSVPQIRTQQRSIGICYLC